MGKPVGAAGLALIQSFEGCRLTAYKPVPTEKYWTIGWGHCGPDVNERETITQAQADALLAADCQRFANAVDNPAYCPLTKKLNANQRDALISFAYNCGEGSLQRLCKGRSLPEIRNAMVLYDRSGGKHLPGLTRRRKAEQALFDTPVKDEQPVERYRYLQDVPAAFRPVIKLLMDAGIIPGSAAGPAEEEAEIDLTYEQAQLLMFMYRGGGFDAKLLAEGLEPAVKVNTART